MAMTRKALKAMGLSEEQIDSIIEMHTETVEGLRTQVNTYKADAEKLPGVQKELDELKKGDGKDYKALYEAEKTAHDKTKSDHAAEKTAAMNERLFRAELTAVGITGKRADQIVKLTDLTQFETDNGAYKDAKAVQDHIRTEYSEFVPDTQRNGANVPNPPSNNGGKYTSRADIMKIKDTGERQKAIAENAALFGL